MIIPRLAWLRLPRCGTPRSSLLQAPLLGLLLVGGACTASEYRTEDSAAGTLGATSDAGAIGSMDEMERTTLVERSTPTDSNQAFLRRMVAHHEALIRMADTARPRLNTEEARADAQRLREGQAAEQQRLQRLLVRDYADSVTPTLLSQHRGMIGSVVKSGTGHSAGPDTGIQTAHHDDNRADLTFYERIVAHHKDGIEVTRTMLTHLKGEVRQMATTMMQQHRREIGEFEQKARRSGS
jgi:uncharacterized protein (DUF305 family)